MRLERGPRQLEDRALPAGVRLVEWAGGRGPFRLRDLPRLALDLRRVVGQLRPDVIHAGPIHSAGLVAALAGVQPLVAMSWGSDMLVDARSSRWMGWLTRYVLRASRALVGDCLAVQQAAAEFGFPPERVTLFPWGVDLKVFGGTLSAFRPEKKALPLRPPEGESPPKADSGKRVAESLSRLGWEDCFVALSLRSWEPIYGVDVIVRGVARAMEREPRLRLVLLGGGSLAGQIQGLLAQAGLHERVHLPGRVSQADLPGYYQFADLYLSASHSDGSSVSLLEALASGLPALVSDIPGNREWIEPGKQGWLFPDGDAEALAEGLLRAAAHPELLAEMSVAARQLAEARANWDANFQKLLDAYQKVLVSGEW